MHTVFKKTGLGYLLLPESESKRGCVLEHLSGVGFALEPRLAVSAGQALSQPGCRLCLLLQPHRCSPSKACFCFLAAGIRSGLAPLKASHFLSKLSASILVQRLKSKGFMVEVFLAKPDALTGQEFALPPFGLLRNTT